MYLGIIWVRARVLADNSLVPPSYACNLIKHALKFSKNMEVYHGKSDIL